MQPSVETWIDLDRYPVCDLEGDQAAKVIGAAREELRTTGAAELSGFIRPEAIDAFVRDATGLSTRAHHSQGEGTAYLEFPDFSLPEGHPRLHFMPYGVRAVAYDLFPLDSVLRRFYEFEPLTRFIEAIVDRGSIYPYADPFGALNVAVMGDGDELQWHFDQTDFVVSLAIQTAEHGGDFEVFPKIRSAENEHYELIDAAIHGATDGLVTLPMTPGTLLIFEGRNSLHRVSPIQGGRLRHVGLLAYDTAPDTVGSTLLRENRYGRSEPMEVPPTTWPIS